MSGPIRILILFLVTLSLIAAAGLYIDQRAREVGTLRVDAGPRSGDSYHLMQELAKVVERHSEILRLELVEQVGREDSPETSSMNGFDLKTVQSHSAAIPKTALVAELYEEMFQIITRADSGITQVSELKGKKLALPPDGSAALQFFWSIGDHYDLFVQEIDWRSMDELSATRALLSNEVDAVFFVGSARNLATRKLIEEFEHTIGAPDLRMLAIDQAPAMGIKRPYIETFVIEKGTFDGSPPLPSEQLTTGAVRRSLVASTETKPRLIRELTRVMFENRSDLIVRFPLADRIKAPEIKSGLKLPLHPGAGNYYDRNEPSFIQENAEPLALLVTVFAMLSSGLLALRSRFNAKQKNKADHYNLQVLQISDQIKQANSDQAFRACHQQLQDLLKRVVDALDNDSVSDEGFQSFAFIWRTVSDELDERTKVFNASLPSPQFGTQAAE